MTRSPELQFVRGKFIPSGYNNGGLNQSATIDSNTVISDKQS